MKLTKGKLRRIIKEEIRRLSESRINVKFQQFDPYEAEMHVDYNGTEYLGTFDVEKQILYFRRWVGMGGTEEDEVKKAMVAKLNDEGYSVKDIKITE